MSFVRNAILACVLGVNMFGFPPIRVYAATLPSGSSLWLRGWPMVGHDPQRTDRSQVTGPTSPHLLFQSHLRIIFPVVDGRGAIYGWSNGIVALSPSLRLRWRNRAFRDVDSPAVVAPNGTFVANGFPRGSAISPGTNRLFGLDSRGRLRWSIHPDLFAKNSSPLVTGGGIIYAPYVGPNAGALNAVSTTGRRLQRLTGASFNAVARSTTGTVYALLSHGGSGAILLTAFGREGRVIWQRNLGTGTSPGQVMVGHRHIYAATGLELNAYDTAGQRLWQYTPDSAVVALAERADGSILLVDRNALVALDAAGKTLWRHAIPPVPSLASAGLAVDATGTAYLALPDGTLEGVSPAGSTLFSLGIGKAVSLATPAVALDPNGRLVVTGTDGGIRVYGK